MNGRMSDSGIGHGIVSAPGRSMNIPHVLVGDDAFGLTSYMMKPYPQIGLTEDKRIG